MPGPSSVTASSVDAGRELPGISLPEISLPELTLRDERRLRRRLETAHRRRDEGERAAALAAVQGEIETARGRLERRRASVPALNYPAELPVSQRRDDLLAAIRDHQVVIVAGETGSGKTTQLPKICLELGRGVRGVIGHTQPRRIAARSVATRIAEELRTPLGHDGVVGYQIRFGDHTGPNTLVKLMTDGILLAELAQDRLLTRYDTIIVDEAHERSLNIDFILGYLRNILPRRPDLKVVVTSATIDPERLSKHFGDAPIIEVSGRTYPVEVRYRPLEGDPDADEPDGDEEPAPRAARGRRQPGGSGGSAGSGGGQGRRPGRGAGGASGPAGADQIQGILTAVDELSAAGPGDILVFLSGEREIRDTADALTARDRPGTEIVPLYARLSAAEQQRVFAPHIGRRIVLATNVAETSLTVPGIRYVIDTGRARISRYSHRTKVQRLPIEPVSRASADQRKGRCGRLEAGICVRLYSEEDFEGRPAFTDPEILRTNLASVILQMAALGLGDIAEFPFVDPPDRRAITDGILLLRELGALVTTEERDAPPRLTPLGRRLAQLPVDPRLGRMILEAERLGCLREVLVIAAALSIQDVRERPVDAEEAAAASHARFTEENSDFLALLNLWNYLAEQQKERSASAFRRMCRAEYLNYLRVREWQDLRGQLRDAAAGLGMTPNSTPADPKEVHQALLAGLLSHIGLRDADKRDFSGARNTRFAIFPGSSLFRKPPRWTMVAELVETSRLWGRIAARIEPDWIEPLAGHLAVRTYSEPRWDRRSGATLATERVTVYGLPIVTGRVVNYGRIDPVTSRDLFIRHALVAGEWDGSHAFIAANKALLAEAAEVEKRVRRRGVVVDDEALVGFFDGRLPAGITSARHFESWWKTARRETPDLFDYPRDLVFDPAAGGASLADYPDVWEVEGQRLRLTYQFTPGEAADGVTVHVPLTALNRLDGAVFDWQVPGLRLELFTALIRSMRKEVRRSFVPAPNFAGALAERVSPADGPLLDALTAELRRMGGAGLSVSDWRPEKVPDHLRVTFRVTDGKGRRVGEGKDLAELKERLRPRLREAVAAAAPSLERGGVTAWDFGDLVPSATGGSAHSPGRFGPVGNVPPTGGSADSPDRFGPAGDLPRMVERRVRGVLTRAYPALVDPADPALPPGTAPVDGGVAIRLFDTEDAARAAMWRGTRALLGVVTASPAPYVRRYLGRSAKLTLTNNPHGGIAALLDDCATCALDAVLADGGGPSWTADGFAALAAAAREKLPDLTLDVVNRVEKVLAASRDAERAVSGLRAPALAAAVADVERVRTGLVYPGFVTATGLPRLPDLVRYLRACERRCEALPRDPGRDATRMRDVAEVTAAYDELLTAVGPRRAGDPEIVRIRWMIEELRVSLFAQSLGTAHPVSVERILRAIDSVELTASTLTR